ncbi:vacuole-associated enzyme activator complex component [Aspergillus terreus]|uniref:Vacuole-associated enzyme activator complex component n=1 Tax=Aspergillus terreus TaxID=33178 RepID=A0A8H3MNC4_ASPTE|nr:vacuole-associated enzyme activator complex component [Aspergillus terreus]
MDHSIQRLLNDKLYDRRKQGALELEKVVRDAAYKGDHEEIQKIVDQLCHDYAYAVHQPHARNGGLIGLAAASIALGSEGVAPYLKEIVPPVLACFSDQDARVRYYACESMYNIAKVAKGEVLLFFNEIFDALSKLASDSELSVKNGAELLDRLVKDIVSESAASFLSEIKRIARLKKGIDGSRKDQGSDNKQSIGSDAVSATTVGAETEEDNENAVEDSEAGSVSEGEVLRADDDWIPGQDVQIDYPRILDILVGFVDTSFATDEEMQLTALRWIDSFFEISPEDILPFVPRLLTQVLPAMSSGSDQVRQAANRVNTSLLEYIVSLSEDTSDDTRQAASSKTTPTASRDFTEGRAPTPSSKADTSPSVSRKQSLHEPSTEQTPRSSIISAAVPPADLDYAAAVNSLTLQFLNENEATRVAALSWLIMLHRKAPRKVVAFNDGTFPALLKTLSDPAEAVVTKDLQLLSQISRNSEDSYFKSFMVNLLQLFSTDRHLLEDIEFASIMVQNLNNNLITAPELSELRKRLRNLDSREGQTFFVALFRSWCHNAVSTFSLCLLAQAYEQAYNLLQVFAELEMTVNMLIQIDKLVQLLESPVFTYLRLQLLEPEKYPYLYKCLYGVLMLLPQSSAFAALKNRLNSVSNIGLLHPGPRGPASSTYDRPSGTRLKRDENSIRWVDLLDKFKSVQEAARRSQRASQRALGGDTTAFPMVMSTADHARPRDRSVLPDAPRAGVLGSGGGDGRGGAAEPGTQKGGSLLGTATKQKSSLPNLGRLGIGGRKSKR